MAAHGRGFCNPRSQRTRTAKKSDATAPGGRRGACFRDLASELLVAGQSHGIGVPLLRGPRSRLGAWLRTADCQTGMRWAINPVHGRETDCRARTTAIRRMALSGGQAPCCARYPHWRARAAERTRIHVPQPPTPDHLPVGTSPVSEDGCRLQGLVDLPRHAVTRLTQSVHLRVFHVVHFPVRTVDCHRHSNPPHRSASVAEVPGTGGESVPAATSHNRTVPSRLPLARVRPSGLKATLVTQSA